MAAIPLLPSAVDAKGTIIGNGGDPLDVPANTSVWRRAWRAGLSLASAALPFVRGGLSTLLTKGLEKAAAWLLT